MAGPGRNRQYEVELAGLNLGQVEDVVEQRHQGLPGLRMMRANSWRSVSSSPGMRRSWATPGMPFMGCGFRGTWWREPAFRPVGRFRLFLRPVELGDVDAKADGETFRRLPFADAQPAAVADRLNEVAVAAAMGRQALRPQASTVPPPRGIARARPPRMMAAKGVPGTSRSAEAR